MIEYASATPKGCIIITDKGKSHSTVYGSDRNIGSTSTPPSPDTSIPESNWTAAAFIILADSDERIITSAIAALAKEGKKLTTSKVALRIQRIERAMSGMTKAPRSYGEYDGTELKQIAREEYPMTDAEKIERLDSMRGTRIHGNRAKRNGMKFTALNQAAHTRILATQEYEEPRQNYTDINVYPKRDENATVDVDIATRRAWYKMD